MRPHIISALPASFSQRRPPCLDPGHPSSCDIAMPYPACGFLSLLVCSLVPPCHPVRPALAVILCLASALGVDAGSGRGHVEGRGTSGLGQIGLHFLCRVVPQFLSPLKRQRDAWSSPSCLLLPLCTQQAQNDTSRSPIYVSPSQGTQIDLGTRQGAYE